MRAHEALPGTGRLDIRHEALEDLDTPVMVAGKEVCLGDVELDQHGAIPHGGRIGRAIEGAQGA